MTVIVSIIGVGRQSGKTSLIEAITKNLSPRFNIGTIKHISSSFDVENKDTWRHLNSGAKIVIAITNNEIVRIRKSNATSLEEALGEVPRNVDLLLVEGFKHSDYPKIIVAQKIEDVKKLLNTVSHVFAIYCEALVGRNWNSIDSIQCIKLDTLITTLQQMLLSDLVNKLPRLNCQSCGFSSCEELAQAILNGVETIEKCAKTQETGVNLRVDGELIYLSSCPGQFLRNTILGMIGSLKGIDKNAIRHVKLEIEI